MSLSLSFKQNEFVERVIVGGLEGQVRLLRWMPTKDLATVIAVSGNV